MAKPDLIEQPKNPPTNDASDKLRAEAGENLSPLRAGDLPGNKSINAMSIGQEKLVSKEQMKDHPAEAAQGVDHMIIAKWDNTSASKFGYDTNHNLISVTPMAGPYPGPMQRLLNDAEAKRRSSNPDATPGWYEIPRGQEGKNGLKPSQLTNHTYIEKEKIYLFKFEQSIGRGTEFVLGRENVATNGWFTDANTFTKYDDDGDIASVRYLADKPGGLISGAKNTQIIPYYGPDGEHGGEKVNGHKISNQFDVIDANGKRTIWTKSKTPNTFVSGNDYKTEIENVNISANGLAWSLRPSEEQRKANTLVADFVAPINKRILEPPPVSAQIPAAPPIEEVIGAADKLAERTVERGAEAQNKLNTLKAVEVALGEAVEIEVDGGLIALGNKSTKSLAKSEEKPEVKPEEKKIGPDIVPSLPVTPPAKIDSSQTAKPESPVTAKIENVPFEPKVEIKQPVNEIETWQDRDARLAAQGFSRLDANNQEFYWRNDRGELLLDKQNQPMPAYHKYETLIAADGSSQQRLVWAPMDDCGLKSKVSSRSHEFLTNLPQ